MALIVYGIDSVTRSRTRMRWCVCVSVRERERERERESERESTLQVNNLVFYAQSTITVMSGRVYLVKTNH